MRSNTATEQRATELAAIAPRAPLTELRGKANFITLRTQREARRARLWLGNIWWLLSAVFSLSWCGAALTYMWASTIINAGLCSEEITTTIHANAVLIATALAPIVVVADLCAASSIEHGIVGACADAALSLFVAIAGTTVAVVLSAITYSATGTFSLAVALAIITLFVFTAMKLGLLHELLFDGARQASPGTVLAHSKFANVTHSRVADTEI